MAAARRSRPSIIHHLTRWRLDHNDTTPLALGTRANLCDGLAPQLADALANDLAKHPEELGAVEAHEGVLPQWMAAELDCRDRDDAGTEEDGEVVMARLLAKYGRVRRSP